LARRNSTGQGLGVIRWPARWPAARFESASESSPTDDGVAAEHADRVVPYWAAKSPENGSPRAASESSLHRAGHVSACGVLPLESWRDVRLGIRPRGIEEMLDEYTHSHVISPEATTGVFDNLSRGQES